jgi:hypothetical protein
MHRHVDSFIVMILAATLLVACGKRQRLLEHLKAAEKRSTPPKAR